nr:hypothetical protein [Tanacetum cinerariifolium]
ISANDNIIFDLDIALELCKSSRITEAEEKETARQVHATHARIVTEYVPEPDKKKTESRSTRSVVIQDTLTTDVMQALKESKKTSRRQTCTGDSSEGTSRIPRVPDESTVVYATSIFSYSDKLKSAYNTITLDGMIVLIFEVGERLVLFEEMIDDNFDIALELGKSSRITEAEEKEAAMQVHATHARIVTESVPEPDKKKTESRSTRSVVIQDTPTTDFMQALKESKKTSRRQTCTGGSTKGTSRIPRVPDESTVVYATSSEGTGTKPGVLDKEKVVSTEEKKLKMRSYKDEEMTNAEVEESRNSDEEYTDAAKTDAKKTEEAKDDSKKVELPLIISSLFVSSGFGDQFLKKISDTSLVGTVKYTTDVEINSILDIKIQSKVPHIQSPSVLKVSVSVNSEPSVLTYVQETPSVALVTTLPPPYVSTTPPVPHQTTAPILAPPIITDAPTITTVVLESDALSAV